MTFWEVLKCAILNKCRPNWTPDNDEYVIWLREQRAASDRETAVIRQRATGFGVGDLIADREGRHGAD